MKKFLKIFAAASAVILLLSGCGSTDNVLEGIVVTKTDNDFLGNTRDVALEAGDTYAIITVEEFGDIKVKLFPEAAPYGVQNFIDLANSGYFTGKNIHRVIGDFMLQGGSLNGNGTGGTSADGGEFYCEINPRMRHFYGALCYANAGGRNTCQFYIVNNKTSQVVNDDYYASMMAEYLDYKNLFLEYRDNYDENSNEYAYFNRQAESVGSSIDGWDRVKGKDTDGSIAAKYAEVGGTPSLDGSYTVFGQTVEGFDVIDAISAVEVTDNGMGEESSPVKEILISSVTIHTA